MSKAKKTRKYAAVKRLISPKDLKQCVFGERWLGKTRRLTSACAHLFAISYHPLPRAAAKKGKAKKPGDDQEVRHV